ncbi:dUTP diphosphatase [Sporosarcina sp. HYO08]|uniref:dUTP diphosphatase n=1 Tax=Sporosarcina sp. HYO08 TaxID=1759557 RepID=UPI000796F86D|nr:dUTP diphosphatase [Sporosarcina sp. HYO08]KXH87219.1 dUTPase [Sporosarcina sp. HYO08]
MKLTKLFQMQQQLDAFIQQSREGQQNVFEEKGLALLVELAELANETRCFKFWSLKGASEKEVILEEYVDSIHFILSLGIEKGFNSLEEWPKGEVVGQLTHLFLKTNQVINQFLDQQTKEAYEQIWIHYGAIAKKLGFTNEDIISAYILKNEENYIRQKSGY